MNNLRHHRWFQRTFQKTLHLTLLSCAVLSPTLHAQTVTFDDAWQLLNQNNHSLKAQQANVARQHALQDATDSLNLPSISVGANYTYLDDDITLSGKQLLDSTGVHITPPPGFESVFGAIANTTSTISERDVFTSSIRLIWPVFTGGRINAAQAAAEGKTEEAKSQFAMERQARYEDLAKYYYSVVLAKEVHQTRLAVEAGLTQHRDFALKLEQQGQIARVERLQAQAALDKAKVESRKAARDVEIAQSALGSILAQSEPVEPSSPLFINQSLPPLRAFTEQTLARYPGLDLLAAKRQQAEALKKAEQGKYYPDVYLYGDYSLHESDSLASQMKPDWLVGIGVNVPLLDTSGRSDKVRAAHSAITQVDALTEQAKQDLRVLVQKTYLEALQASEEVQGLQSSISVGEENLSLRQKSFRQGLSSSLDVVDAQLYLASIETQQSAARFRYLVSLAKLLALSSEMESLPQYERQALSADLSTQPLFQGQ